MIRINWEECKKDKLVANCHWIDTVLTALVQRMCCFVSPANEQSEKTTNNAALCSLFLRTVVRRKWRGRRRLIALAITYCAVIQTAVIYIADLFLSVNFFTIFFFSIC